MACRRGSPGVPVRGRIEDAPGSPSMHGVVCAEGGALACLVQSGLKATCVTPRASTI